MSAPQRRVVLVCALVGLLAVAGLCARTNRSPTSIPADRGATSTHATSTHRAERRENEPMPLPSPSSVLALPEARNAPGEVVLRARWGSGPSELGRKDASESNPEAPMAIALDGDQLLVLDQVNARLQRFDRGRLAATVPIGTSTAQDVTTASDGRLVVLDRFGESNVQVFARDGALVRRLPLVGGSITEGTSVTGVFATRDGIYVEREHAEAVRIGLGDAKADEERPDTWGRPSRDGTSTVRASIVDRASGVVEVAAANLASGQRTWTERVRFGEPLLHLSMLDTDARGNVYVGIDSARDSGPPAHTAIDAKTTVVRLAPDGSRVTGVLDLPPWPASDEVFRPLAVDLEGTVYQLSPGPDGLEVVRYRFAD